MQFGSSVTYFNSFPFRPLSIALLFEITYVQRLLLFLKSGLAQILRSSPTLLLRNFTSLPSPLTSSLTSPASDLGLRV